MIGALGHHYHRDNIVVSITTLFTLLMHISLTFDDNLVL